MGEENKIQLEILGLSNSLSESGAYTLVLGNNEREMHLPIIIGNFEAQAIAMELENIKSNRPLTHDLMKNIMDSFGVFLDEVLIEQFKEGIFYVKMILSNGKKTQRIDARASDSVAMAIKFNKPIYATSEVIDAAGVVMKESMERQGDGLSSIRRIHDYTMEELDDLLQIAIEQEDYEQASLIRDEILLRKAKK